MIYGLIRSGVVENTIVADQSFADAIASSWDYVIRIDNLDPQPSIGWAYDGVDFTPPV